MSELANIVLSLRTGEFLKEFTPLGNHTSTFSHLPPGHLDLTDQPHKDRMKDGRRVTRITHGATNETLMMDRTARE